MDGQLALVAELDTNRGEPIHQRICARNRHVDCLADGISNFDQRAVSQQEPRRIGFRVELLLLVNEVNQAVECIDEVFDGRSGRFGIRGDR